MIDLRACGIDVHDDFLLPYTRDYVAAVEVKTDGAAWLVTITMLDGYVITERLEA